MSLEKIRQIFKYVFTWVSYVDARSCPKCVALNGREYHDQDLFAPVLVDSEFGPVWDLNADISLMHGASGTCRCRLFVRVESIDLGALESVQDLQKVVTECL